MGRKLTLSEEQINIIKNMYEQHIGSSTIAKVIGKKTGTVTHYITKYLGGLRSQSEANRKYVYNVNFFEEINTEEKAYWLGFIYADGYISKTASGHSFGISLSINDKEHLEKFKKSLSSNIEIRTYKNNSGYTNNEYCRILISNKKIVSDLEKHGVVEHKTLILKKPDIDEKFFAHFIRGYLDGDGCISYCKSNKSYTIKIVGTDSILNFIKIFIEKNTNCKINKFYKRRKDDIVSSLELGGNLQVRKVLDILYKDANIYLDRKFERYRNLIELLNCRALSKDKRLKSPELLECSIERISSQLS